MSLRARIANRLFGDIIDERVRLAIPVYDNAFWHQISPYSPTGIPWHERHTQLKDIQTCVQENPLAARLVKLTTDFVIGAGGKLTGDGFAQTFWAHPQNDMANRIYRWCDELSKTGELFTVLSRDPGGTMSYVRELPAIAIDSIDFDNDDLEHELRYHQMTENVEGRWWPGAYANPGIAMPSQVVLHFSINKPIGDVRGVSDLAQNTIWLNRYATWLEDRVRINRFKGAFLWHVTITNPAKGVIAAKKRQYATPPPSGSLIVSDASEQWEAINPRIDAGAAEADGKAIRLMIAAGAGIPLHFLAEGESATRATAREQGTPTYRHFSHRQAIFAAIIQKVIRTAGLHCGHPNVQAHIAFEPVLAEDRRTDPEGPEGERTPGGQTDGE